MLTAKREHDGFLAAWTAAEIVRHIPFGGESLDPHSLNPFRVADPAAERKLQEVRRFIASVAIETRAREAKEEAERARRNGG
jgi:hypothetical protein